MHSTHSRQPFQLTSTMATRTAGKLRISDIVEPACIIPASYNAPVSEWTVLQGDRRTVEDDAESVGSQCPVSVCRPGSQLLDAPDRVAVPAACVEPGGLRIDRVRAGIVGLRRH